MHLPFTHPRQRVTSRAAPDGDDVQSEHRYRAPFEGMPNALYRVKPDGSMVAANQALAELVGCENGDRLLERNAAEGYVDPAVRDQVMSRFAAGEEAIS